MIHEKITDLIGNTVLKLDGLYIKLEGFNGAAPSRIGQRCG